MMLFLVTIWCCLPACLCGIGWGCVGHHWDPEVGGSTPSEDQFFQRLWWDNIEWLNLQLLWVQRIPGLLNIHKNIRQNDKCDILNLAVWLNFHHSITCLNILKTIHRRGVKLTSFTPSCETSGGQRKYMSWPKSLSFHILSRVSRFNSVFIHIQVWGHFTR